MKNVLDDILDLSVAERLQLVEDIWDSIAATPEAVPVTAAQRKELARRKRAHARNPAAAKSWEEVRAKLRAPRSVTVRLQSRASSDEGSS